MKQFDWKKLTKRRVLGIGILVVGAIMIFAPIFFCGWIIALLGVALLADGLQQFIEIFRSDNEDWTMLSYVADVFIAPLSVR